MSNSGKLFLPSSHSGYQVSWQKIPAGAVSGLRIILSQNYGLDNIADILQVKAWESLSNNFKVVTSLGQCFLLRRHIQHKESDLLNKINEILIELAKDGLKTPVIIKTILGGNCAYSKDDVWQLFEFIPGDYYRGTKEEIIAAALGIASLHNCLAKIKVLDLPDIPPRITNEEWGNISSSSEFDDGTILKALKKNSQKLIEMRKQVIHSDLHPHNLLFSGGKLSAIIDFGNIAVGDERLDLASALHRLVRQFIINSDQDWEKQWFAGSQLFMEAYCRIREIPEDFLPELSFWMREAILRKVSQINLWYQAGERNPADLKFELRKFSSLLLEIDAVENLYEEKIN